MPPQFSKLTGCVPIVTQRYAWAYWLPVLVFESIMLSLSVVKSVRQAQEDTRTPYVMVVLLRDSVVYYGGIIGPILINCIVWKSKVCALHATRHLSSFATHIQVSLFFAFVPSVYFRIEVNTYVDLRLCSEHRS